MCIMVPGVELLYMGLDIEVVKRYNKLLDRQTTTDLDAVSFLYVFCLLGKESCFSF